MIDRDKVVEALQNCISEPKCPACTLLKCEYIDQATFKLPKGLVMDMLDLIKEQKPLLVFKKWHKNPLGDYMRNHCPKCDNEIEKPTFISKNTSYCPYYGQAVKWE